jgi:hypothetical protein
MEELPRRPMLGCVVNSSNAHHLGRPDQLCRFAARLVTTDEATEILGLPKFQLMTVRAGFPHPHPVCVRRRSGLQVRTVRGRDAAGRGRGESAGGQGGGNGVNSHDGEATAGRTGCCGRHGCRKLQMPR